MNYEIAKDAVKDAEENRRLNGLCKDKGLLEALRIINYCQTEEEEAKPKFDYCRVKETIDLICKGKL